MHVYLTGIDNYYLELLTVVLSIAFVSKNYTCSLNVPYTCIDQGQSGFTLR